MRTIRINETNGVIVFDSTGRLTGKRLLSVKQEVTEVHRTLPFHDKIKHLLDEGKKVWCGAAGRMGWVEKVEFGSKGGVAIHIKHPNRGYGCTNFIGGDSVRLSFDEKGDRWIIENCEDLEAQNSNEQVNHPTERRHGQRGADGVVAKGRKHPTGVRTDVRLRSA
jgi:hypothetical protein